MENIKFAFDELDLLMAKVARVHGDNHPELNDIKNCYENIKKAYEENNVNIIKDELKKVDELSNNLTLPSDACQAYTRVYKAFGILEEQYK